MEDVSNIASWTNCLVRRIDGENMKFCFGDIVVVDECNIGVIVKSWNDHTYDVYVRMRNDIFQYREEKIERYMVRHKYLDEEELVYQNNAVNEGGDIFYKPSRVKGNNG